jgi:uncharacterized protein YdeI (YjbR/CyaY-like superfamily)
MNLLHVTTRRAWRAWLARHHKAEPEVWLVYYRKDSGKPRISYDDAVLEALAYGWIDSTQRKIDDERLAQRFSPRRPASKLSQMNIERVRQLIRAGQMTKAGLAAIAHAYDPGKDTVQPVAVPSDILAAIKAQPAAWANFQELPEAYKRIRIAYIDSRRRHGDDMFQRALRNFVTMTAKGKRIGSVREWRDVT